MLTSNVKRVIYILAYSFVVVILTSAIPSMAQVQSSEVLPQWVKRLQAAVERNEALRKSIESGEVGSPVVVGLSQIGLSQKSVPIYLVKISSPNVAIDNPKCIFVVAAQHGDEPAGPQGMLKLIEQFAESTDPEVEKPLRWTELYIVPVANPDGFAVGHRLMSNHRNLNRDWRVRRTPEARAIWSWVIQLKPSVLFDLHENTPRDRAGAYIDLIRPCKGVASPSIISQMLRKHGHRVPVRSCSGVGGLLHTEFSRALKKTGCLVETKYRGDRNLGLGTRGDVHLTAVMSVVKALSLREQEVSPNVHMAPDDSRGGNPEVATPQAK